jgi:hypothetical protein
MFTIITKIWNALTSMRDAKGTLGKNWIRSKTLWANIIAMIAIIGQHYLGFDLTADDTVVIMGFVNIVLRLITTEPVGFIDRGTK